MHSILLMYLNPLNLVIDEGTGILIWVSHFDMLV